PCRGGSPLAVAVPGDADRFVRVRRNDAAHRGDDRRVLRLLQLLDPPSATVVFWAVRHLPAVCAGGAIGDPGSYPRQRGPRARDTAPRLVGVVCAATTRLTSRIRVRGPDSPGPFFLRRRSWELRPFVSGCA